MSNVDSQSTTEDCPFKCGVCYTEFAKITDLLDHLKIHMLTKKSGEKHFEPLETNEKKTEVPFVKEKHCKSCDKSFKKNIYLKRHIAQVHDKIKNTKCFQCNKTFFHHQDLKIHTMAVHDKIKNFKCKSCEKTFSQKGNMKTHYETRHLGIRNFKCNLCTETFTQNQYLQNHFKRLHSKITT